MLPSIHEVIEALNKQRDSIVNSDAYWKYDEVIKDIAHAYAEGKLVVAKKVGNCMLCLGTGLSDRAVADKIGNLCPKCKGTGEVADGTR